MLETGKQAADFSLQDQTGKIHDLKSLKGQYSLIYFYPKDDTPGCTVQACALRDNLESLEQSGLHVLGVSADDVKSHEKFSSKYNLPFPVLSDPSKQMIEAYGAWAERNMYGRKFMGIVRSAVIIAPDLTIATHWPKIAPLKTVPEAKKWMAEHATA